MLSTASQTTVIQDPTTIHSWVMNTGTKTWYFLSESLLEVGILSFSFRETCGWQVFRNTCQPQHRCMLK